MDDNMKHKAEEKTGTVKRKAGEFTDDPEMEAEGRFDEGKSKGKQAADRAGDTARDMKEGVKDKARQVFDRDN